MRYHDMVMTPSAQRAAALREMRRLRAQLKRRTADLREARAQVRALIAKLARLPTS